MRCGGKSGGKGARRAASPDAERFALGAARAPAARGHAVPPLSAAAASAGDGRGMATTLQQGASSSDLVARTGRERQRYDAGARLVAGCARLGALRGAASCRLRCLARRAVQA